MSSSCSSFPLSSWTEICFTIHFLLSIIWSSLDLLLLICFFSFYGSHFPPFHSWWFFIGCQALWFHFVRCSSFSYSFTYFDFVLRCSYLETDWSFQGLLLSVVGSSRSAFGVGQIWHHYRGNILLRTLLNEVLPLWIVERQTVLIPV